MTSINLSINIENAFHHTNIILYDIIDPPMIVRIVGSRRLPCLI